MPIFLRCPLRWFLGFLLLRLGATSACSTEIDTEKGYIGCGLSRQKENSFKVYDLIGQGPAALAGLRNGDLVVAINGTPAAQLPDGAADGKIGSVAKFSVQRGGSTLEMSIARAPFLDIYFAPAVKGDKAAQSWLHWYLSGVASPEICAKVLEWLRARADEGNGFAGREPGSARVSLFPSPRRSSSAATSSIRSGAISPCPSSF